jgi:solute carrier family 35 protein E3
MWHFFCTSSALYIASLPPFNLFVSIRLPFWQMIPLSFLFVSSLLLNNLSLTFNSVGFYQISKIMTTPAVVFLNLCLFRKTISMAMTAALVSVCVGVALTNSNGLQISHLVGILLAVAAFMVTAAYQIWIGKKLIDFGTSSPQLLLNQATISVGLLVFIAPFSDTILAVNLRFIQPQTWLALVLSGLCAAVLNLSQFLIIGRTSALTVSLPAQRGEQSNSNSSTLLGISKLSLLLCLHGLALTDS